MIVSSRLLRFCLPFGKGIDLHCPDCGRDGATYYYVSAVDLYIRHYRVRLRGNSEAMLSE